MFQKELKFIYIVPQEFYSALSPVSRPTPAASRSKAARRVADTQLEQGVRPFPLGNPGHYTYYQVCR